MFKGLKSFVHSHCQCLAPLSILNMHVIVEFGKFGVGVQVQISEKKISGIPYLFWNLLV